MQKETPLKQVFDKPQDANLEQSFQLLIAFCAEYQQELLQLFQTKLVQTNEVQRASYLYPLLSEISAQAKKPLTLIEIGTSAYLLLNVDHYHYSIHQGETITLGDQTSPLTLQAKNLGEPIVFTQKPIIQNRIGIDLNIINLHDEAAISMATKFNLTRAYRAKSKSSNRSQNSPTMRKTITNGRFHRALTQTIGR